MLSLMAVIPVGTGIACAQRFALGSLGGTLSRTLASFRLSEPRFASLLCLGWLYRANKLEWWASRWLSASRRWRCRPSQPRIGLANRFPGFWSDRTPLAHACAYLSRAIAE